MSDIRVKNQICEQAFRDSNEELKLPLGMRCYLDGYAHEFNRVDIETKLYHFGYLAIRKVHFYRELKDNINEKMKQPQYHGYEDCAINSLVRYICYLRTGKENDVFFAFYRRMSFRQLYLMLVRELKLRYYEYNDYRCDKDCYRFNEYIWNSDDIMQRFKGNRQGLIEYIMTVKETRRIKKELEKK